MIRTELSFRLPNSPGSLAQAVAQLASEQIRILACSIEASGTARIVADNPGHAATALERHHVRVERRDVICSLVPARSLHVLLDSIARAGINVEYAYASSREGDESLMLVLGIEDAARVSAAAGI